MSLVRFRPKAPSAGLAHLVERHLAKVEVASSSLVGRSICGSLAQLGEHLPYKQRVSGSSPLTSTKFGPVVQLVRTLACHARGRRFEPVPGRQFFASVAQSVEQGTENPRVDGSIPSGGTKNADVAHLVERHLAKVEVAGSSPVARSIFYRSEGRLHLF